MKTNLAFFGKIASVIVVIAAMTSCAFHSGDLSRDQAKTMLERDGYFVNPVTEQVGYGIVTYPAYTPQSPLMLSRYDLVRRGLIILNKYGSPQGGVQQYSLQFSNFGMQSVVSKGNDGNEDFYNVKVARRQLVEVTGIQTLPGGTQAYINFTWKYYDFSPFTPAIEMWTGSPKYTDNQVYPMQSIATKYDDGWRLGN